MKDAFIIGLAQACAGCCRGCPVRDLLIATGLLLGDNKAKLAQFSFLMVIPPILGEALLDSVKMMKGEDVVGISLRYHWLLAFWRLCSRLPCLQVDD